MKKLLFISVISFGLISCGSDSSSGKSEKEVVKTTHTLDTALYTSKGKEIAQATFKTLSSRLKSAMQNGGVENAISYCNIHAMPLTDSLSKVFDAKIQRISHKPRNINNAANDEELTLITKYQNTHSTKPTLLSNEDKVIFYAPIYTKPLCLTCHGTVGETITEKNYEVIKSFYPEDKATGFKVDELRGLWKITFGNKN